MEQIKKSSVFEGVTPYHWMVVLIASGGWLFDCMDQRIFALAREPALTELLHGNDEGLAKLKSFGGMATGAMILGWATGGLIFGVMSDKFGRVKTMIATLLVYSGFTGLSGYSHSWQEFMIYRFLVGLGVGGMFGAATTLVAESVPPGFRTLALGSLQALSATGNILGSLISTKIQPG
ncbi:MAG: MFS transporter, partial [Candidatus Omnitrophica bacterium]|nr:MFS transporter [Candidatus Omnitrophota bacterium]